MTTNLVTHGEESIASFAGDKPSVARVSSVEHDLKYYD